MFPCVMCGSDAVVTIDTNATVLLRLEVEGFTASGVTLSRCSACGETYTHLPPLEPLLAEVTRRVRSKSHLTESEVRFLRARCPPFGDIGDPWPRLTDEVVTPIDEAIVALGDIGIAVEYANAVRDLRLSERLIADTNERLYGVGVSLGVIQARDDCHEAARQCEPYIVLLIWLTSGRCSLPPLRFVVRELMRHATAAHIAAEAFANAAAQPDHPKTSSASTSASSSARQRLRNPGTT